MLNIELTLNALSLTLMIFGALFAGYQLRSRQLKKKQFKIAELRKAKELAGDYVQLPPRYQRAFVDDAVNRIVAPSADA